MYHSCPIKMKKSDLFIPCKSTKDLKEFNFHKVKGLNGPYKKD